MDEARVRADVLGDAGEERDHVVLHLALDLGDARGVEAGAPADRSSAAPGITPRSASTSQTASSTRSQKP